MSMNDTRSIKIFYSTYRRLKVLAAQSGETLMGLVERLSVQEEERQQVVRSVVRSDSTKLENTDES
jgi:hypothetical protein